MNSPPPTIPASEPHPRRKPIRVLIACAILLAIAAAIIVVVLLFKSAPLIESGPTRSAVTQANGKMVMQMVRIYLVDKAQLPSSLGAMVPEFLNELPADGWSRTFIYTVDQSGTARLQSYGADAKLGGADEDADLWWQMAPGGTLTSGTGSPPRWAAGR